MENIKEDPKERIEILREVMKNKPGKPAYAYILPINDGHNVLL